MLQIYHHCIFFQSFLCAIFLSPTVKKINSLHNLSNGCCTLCFLVESRNCGIKFGLSATTCTVCCEFYNDVVLSKEVKLFKTPIPNTKHRSSSMTWSLIHRIEMHNINEVYEQWDAENCDFSTFSACQITTLLTTVWGLRLAQVLFFGTT